jgi:RHS repeat-associated protein
VEEHANTASFSSRYLFNAKELDPETGRYYYGARYYDPGLSIWLSVDPLAGDFPNLTPYNFVKNNPILLVDPDGRAPGPGDPEKRNKEGIQVRGKVAINTGVVGGNVSGTGIILYPFKKSLLETNINLTPSGSGGNLQNNLQNYGPFETGGEAGINPVSVKYTQSQYRSGGPIVEQEASVNYGPVNYEYTSTENGDYETFGVSFGIEAGIVMLGIEADLEISYTQSVSNPVCDSPDPNYEPKDQTNVEVILIIPEELLDPAVNGS